MSAPLANQKSDHWGSRFGFIMAAVGSSVGLGNLWRFPYTAGENGGSAFILIYIGAILLFGVPVLMAEYAVGRYGQRSSIATIRKIAVEEKKPIAWVGMGWIGAFASLLLFSFYIVISAWVFDFIPQAFSGSFSGFENTKDILNASFGADVASLKQTITSTHLSDACNFVADGRIVQVAEQLDQDAIAASIAAGETNSTILSNGQLIPLADLVGKESVLRDIRVGDVSSCRFAETVGNKTEIWFYTAGFLALNVFVVARGVHGGIEKAAEILMPAFFIMLLGMVGFGLFTGNVSETAAFLFQPDFSKINFQVVLSAVGQAFFSLSVGSCVMMTYGAYLQRSTNIPKNAGLVAGADTSVALIAGFAIFPIVFAAGLQQDAGPGLFFVTMPVAFGQLPFFVGGAFFTLALFAAFTSSVSLFEVGVSWLEDQRGIGRLKGAIGLGVVMILAATAYIFNGDLIDQASFISGDVLLPLGGVLIGIFAGWIVPKHIMASELGEGPLLNIILFLLRFVVPIAISVILIVGITSKFSG